MSLRRRLRQLLEHRYVERLTLPLVRNRPVASPPDEYVYRLGRKGITVAREHTHDDLKYVSEKKATLLEHDLKVTSFHLALALAVRDSGRFQLVWQQRNLQDHAQGEHGQPLSVNPDALFALTDTVLPAGENTCYFFLEIVRARESEYVNGQSYLMRKFRAYIAYAQQGHSVNDPNSILGDIFTTPRDNAMRFSFMTTQSENSDATKSHAT